MSKTLVTYYMRTQVLQAPGASAMLPEVLAQLGCRRPVLYADPGLTQAGVTARVAQWFDLPHKGHGPQLAGIFDKIPQDAESSMINEGARFYREQGADGLIALGGGSVQDSVKCIKFILDKGGNDILALMPGNFCFETPPSAKPMNIPHVGIATTAGTGAEVSPAAVVFNSKDKIKGDLAHPYVGPDVAILDPELTVSLPPKLTAATAFDALTHAIEGVASPGSNVFTDAYGFEAVSAICRNLLPVLEKPSYIEGRNALLGASCVAILSFVYAVPGAFPVHNFAHAIGAHFRVHHGTANALFLTAVMEAMPDLYLRRAKDLARAMELHAVAGQSAEKALEAVIGAIKTLRRQSGLPDRFSELGINPSAAMEVLPMAVMRDPIGLIYPIPLEIIGQVLQNVL
jgi:alcohol dehydrogenase class IV